MKIVVDPLFPRRDSYIQKRILKDASADAVRNLALSSPDPRVREMARNVLAGKPPFGHNGQGGRKGGCF